MPIDLNHTIVPVRSLPGALPAAISIERANPPAEVRDPAIDLRDLAPGHDRQDKREALRELPAGLLREPLDALDEPRPA